MASASPLLESAKVGPPEASPTVASIAANRRLLKPWSSVIVCSSTERMPWGCGGMPRQQKSRFVQRID
jgi:hypothetical protein